LTPEQLLDFLRSRRSRRSFAPTQLTQEELEPLFEAARTAPSATNRQPWRYNVVLDPTLRGQIIEAIRQKVKLLKKTLEGSEYLEELKTYGDFFFEPLEAAPCVIVPQWRPFPDAIASLVKRAGRDPAPFTLSEKMPSELCGTAAATMNLLLMAEASGFACCWMAGPMLAREEIAQLLEIPSPWSPLGAIAIGRPSTADQLSVPSRKSIERIVEWNLPKSKQE
jgi:coenzyme F420-0:L-glutamate ligase/coenzyme F420-1:gamma-L-glutamate ligase